VFTSTIDADGELVGYGDTEGTEADGQDVQHEVTFEELVVLDAAGRLQVPRDYLEEFLIGDRARLEVTDEGILIRPVEGRAAQSRASEQESWDVQVGGLYLEEDEPPASQGKKVLQWLRRIPGSRGGVRSRRGRRSEPTNDGQN
jgi:hypothetical protein